MVSATKSYRISALLAVIWHNCFIEFYNPLIEVFQIAQLLAKADTLVITNLFLSSLKSKWRSENKNHEIPAKDFFFDIAFLKEWFVSEKLGQSRFYVAAAAAAAAVAAAVEWWRRLNEKYVKLVSTCLGDFGRRAFAEDQVMGIAAGAACLEFRRGKKLHHLKDCSFRSRCLSSLFVSKLELGLILLAACSLGLPGRVSLQAGPLRARVQRQ